jgi:preprotein translocase subunit SecA
MLDAILKKILGTKHEREMKRMRPLVDAINALEPEYKKKSDAELRAKTFELKGRIEKGEPLDSALPEAFANCREGAQRALGMRHYDVQLIGGMVLNRGRIAEMKTGEGKTLVATLACYLNALEGKGVHVVTVNDYLARRDAEWMGRLYGFLGMSTGVVVSQQGDANKKRAYRCDITYGQNNEFGFDYLRDNMKFSIYDYVQRDLHYAIVDEVDSILVDEARTPLIISGRGRTASDKYVKINEMIPRLKKDEHFAVDEKANSVTLSEEGIEVAQRELFKRGLTEVENLFEPVNLESLHILQKLLQAHALYKRDQQYIVSEDGRVLIIDEFTGRVLPGRRWSDGMHQAVEAKENVAILDESATLATISFQNLFRLYKKLCGMTGTADTEAAEFHKIYNLEVAVIPTHRPILRADQEDLIYKTEREKFKAVVRDLKEHHERGQPVLVGTTSVEKSDAVSRLLTKEGIPHNVLNAKQHEREAYVVAQAGKKGAVTVATNMAGRGTDIVLGGNAEMLARYEVLQAADEALRNDAEALAKAVEEATAHYKQRCEDEKKDVLAAGGLHILGTERHESRRIDNQLRGRGGRQGDPGSSRFYLSLEDDLMRIFAGDRIQLLMDKLGMEEDIPIEHKWVTKAVENAQTKVEQRNFDIRKHMLEYDDVMNQQRKSIYALRKQVLSGMYRTEPTKAERERGFVPPPRVPTADPHYLELVANPLESFVKLSGAPGLPRDATPEQQTAWRDAALTVKLDDLKQINTAQLEQAVYVNFGCKTELREFQSDPKGCLEALKQIVPMSLTEQRERLMDLIDEVIGTMVGHACPPGKHFEDWDKNGLVKAYQESFDIEASGVHAIINAQEIAHKLYDDASAVRQKREKDVGELLYMRVFRNFFLQEIDNQWLEHLQNMDALRDGIGLRGYGQRDPKKEYQKEGFDLFLELMQNIKASVVHKMFHFVIEREDEVQRLEEERRKRLEQRQQRMQASHAQAQAAAAAAAAADANEGAAAAGSSANPAQGARASQAAPIEKQATVKRERPKVGRNDPCWCGSGKKYKSCHLKEDAA